LGCPAGTKPDSAEATRLFLSLFIERQRKMFTFAWIVKKEIMPEILEANRHPIFPVCFGLRPRNDDATIFS
jgi:hypothetical protein